MENSVKLCRDHLELLERSVGEFGESVFMQTETFSVTFTEFFQMVMRIGHSVKAMPETCLVLEIQDQVYYAAAYFAVILTGHITCLLPEGHALPEQLRSSRCLCDSEVRDFLTSPALQVSDLTVPEPDDVCTIAFSSGTTSNGKGIMLSQKNLLTDIAYSVANQPYQRGERLVHILPFCHLFGLVADLLNALFSGCCLCMPSSSYQFFQALQRYQPDTVNMPPALAEALCSAIASSGGDTSGVTGGHLKRVLCAGAPLKEETFEMLRKYGILPCQAYGMTECSPCVAVTKGSDVKPGTCGVPIGCAEFRISHDGEIQIRGPIVMQGYLGDESSCITDGWYASGDCGYFDETGHLVITGRMDNMLIFKDGTKCIPETIEKELARLDGIEESLLRIDPETELPGLLIVSPRGFAQEQADAVMRSAGLFPYIVRVQTQALRRNAMGKVVRTQ